MFHVASLGWCCFSEKMTTAQTHEGTLTSSRALRKREDFTSWKRKIQMDALAKCDGYPSPSHLLQLWHGAGRASWVHRTDCGKPTQVGCRVHDIFW